MKFICVHVWMTTALASAFWLVTSTCSGQSLAKPPGSIRFATFNASLNRAKQGELVQDLSKPDDPQIKNVAEVIQRVRPDVLLINEFDHDADGPAPGSRAATLFEKNYLKVAQQGAEPIEYPYVFVPTVNTGVPSGLDLDNDGQVARTPGSRGYGNDSQGFGQFPGQYGYVIFSKFSIAPEVGQFQTLLWKDVPGALLPKKEDGASWYSDKALGVLRLSSKNHTIVTIKVGATPIALLASHPTPPAFDGPEHRNARRNHDEIRLWADYLTGGAKAAYLAPTLGLPDGVAVVPPSTFVVMGDLNADPVDGASASRAIDQLLKHSSINSENPPRSEGAAEAARVQKGANLRHQGDPAFDTADFADATVGNLHVDYVLPSRNLRVLGSGVFWPVASDPLARLVTMTPSPATSDHRLVYLDVAAP
jgi:Endonuclease/Exonuclease/phosphatase family